MNRKHFILSFLVVLFLPAAFLSFIEGCKKTSSPFGLYAPNGLDVPTATPLPLTGAIVVNVADTGVQVNGVSVVAIAPGAASTLIQVTTGQGQAAFNPDPIALGVWTIDIPQQVVSSVQYDFSQQFVTVGSGFSEANLNFSTGVYNVAFVPLNGTSFPTTLQNNLPFNVNLSYTGTLNIPVSLSFVGNIFPYTGGPNLLDASVTQASVTFQIPSCNFTEPVLYAKVSRLNGNTLINVSGSVTLTRGYPVTITSVNVSEALACQEFTSGGSHPTSITAAQNINDTWTINTAGECPGHPFHVHVVFSSTNDSSTSTPSQEDFTMSANTPFIYSWKPPRTSPVHYSWTLTDMVDPNNTWSGGFIFDPHWALGGSCSCSAINGAAWTPSASFQGCGNNALSALTNLVLIP